MPAVSEKQRRFFGAEISRKRAGKKTKTAMTEKQMTDFASGPVHPHKKRMLGPARKSRLFR